MIDIEVLRTAQKQLSLFIFAKGYLSWNGIRKACQNIILALSVEQKKNFEDKLYPEFDIFIPLLRNGSAEVCRSKDRATLLYTMNPKLNLTFGNGNQYIRTNEFFSTYKNKINVKKYKEEMPFEDTFDSMEFLKSYQSIQQQILNYAVAEVKKTALHFEQNLKNYQYEKIDKTEKLVGIYKLDDRAWTSPYLLDKEGFIRKIAYYAEDPDAMNIARLYVRIFNQSFTKPIFEYDNGLKELVCYRYSELPILLTRALILFEPKQLSSKEFCTNHPSVPFKNVPLEAVKELKRIFSDKMVVTK